MRRKSFLWCQHVWKKIDLSTFPERVRISRTVGFQLQKVMRNGTIGIFGFDLCVVKLQRKTLCFRKQERSSASTFLFNFVSSTSPLESYLWIRSWRHTKCQITLVEAILYSTWNFLEKQISLKYIRIYSGKLNWFQGIQEGLRL